MVRVRHTKVARVVVLVATVVVISAGMTGVDNSISAKSGVSRWRRCRKSRLH